jgi:hypothetical protein
MTHTTTVDDAKNLAPPSRPHAPGPKKKTVERLLDAVERAVGVTLVAMLGVGVADAAGLIGALIRKLIGDSPFMNGLIVFVTLLFLAVGLAYGIGARTIRSTVDVTSAMEKAVAGALLRTVQLECGAR